MAAEIARLSSELAEIQSALENKHSALGHMQTTAMQASGIAACELAIFRAELEAAERDSVEVWEGRKHAMSAACAAADAQAKVEEWARAQETAAAEAKTAAVAAETQLHDAVRRALTGEAEARREREHAEASNEAVRSLTQKHSLELSSLRAQFAQERAKSETERAATQNEMTARLKAVCVREAQMASAMGKVSRSSLMKPTQRAGIARLLPHPQSLRPALSGLC
jgi:type I site-specific restriction endonuclease